MKLSPNFTLGEMTKSATASRLGLDNVPGAAVIAALRLLCAHVLEPVRAHYGRPVLVTSGYRAPKVNRAAKGAAGSQHVLGEAADIHIPGVSNYDLCDWIHRHLNYDQLIYEFGEGGWCHISWSATRMRNMELTARREGTRTVYLPGLVR